MTAGGAKTRADRQRAKREPASTKKGRPKPDLTIIQTQVFRGPNYWSYEPCIRMLVVNRKAGSSSPPRATASP